MKLTVKMTKMHAAKFILIAITTRMLQIFKNMYFPDLPCHQDRRFVISNSVFYSWSPNSDGRVRLSAPDASDAPDTAASPASDGEEAVSCDSYNFDDYEIIHENDESLSVSESYRAKVSNSPFVT